MKEMQLPVVIRGVGQCEKWGRIKSLALMALVACSEGNTS